MKGNGSDDCKIKVVATCFSADFKQKIDLKLDQIPLHRMHERISHSFFTDQKSDKKLFLATYSQPVSKVEWILKS